MNNNNNIMSLNFFSFDEIFYPKPIDKNTFQIVYPLDTCFFKNNCTFDIGYINKYTKDTGSYIIIINSNIIKQATFFDSIKKSLDWQDTLSTNITDTNPNAIFCISKSNKLHNGSINKLSCSNSSGQDERVGGQDTLNADLVETRVGGQDSINIEWNPCEYPLLKYNKCNSLHQQQDEDNLKNLSLVFNIKVIST